MCAPNRTHNDCGPGGEDLKPTPVFGGAISQRQIWILKRHVFAPAACGDLVVALVTNGPSDPNKTVPELGETVSLFRLERLEASD